MLKDDLVFHLRLYVIGRFTNNTLNDTSKQSDSSFATRQHLSARYFPLLGREGIRNVLGEWLCYHIQRGVCLQINSGVFKPLFY